MARIVDRSSNEIVRVPISKIKTNHNSRTTVSYEELDQLMASIKQSGLLQPIGLSKSGSTYEVIFGNRRFLACSKLGWTNIPSVIREEQQEFDFEIENVVENVQRRQLTLVEIGRYVKLFAEKGISIKEAAVRMGLERKYVEACADAYQRVPDKFKDSIEVRNTPKRGVTGKPGTLTVRQAQSIMSATKNLMLDKTQEEALYRAAKFHGPKFHPSKAREYASNIKLGKDPMANVVGTREIHLHVVVTNQEFERLHKKYVENGPFMGLRKVAAAILAGEIKDTIKSTAF